MPSQSRFPGTAVNDASAGHASLNWGNPNDALSDNGVYVVCNSAALIFSSTNLLRVTNFGFYIPFGATIDGIEVEVIDEHLHNSGAITTARAQIYKTGWTGASKNTARNWTTSLFTELIGSPTDKWGIPAGTLTRDYVMASDFGFGIALDNGDDDANEMRIDAIRMTVYYSGGASGRKLLLGVG